MRKLWMTLVVGVLVVGLVAPAFAANGSAVDQFSAVKYIRNLSDLACQYRDHGLSLQLDGYNYEWLIFQDSCVRQNIEAELVVLGRSRKHIIDPLGWQLHVDMLGATIDQINTICEELGTYNFCPDTHKLIAKIAKKANEGESVLGKIEDELGRGEERNYCYLATYGEKLWLIGNDLICLVKDLDFENWVALYSSYVCAGDCCQNEFPVCAACWDCEGACGDGCPVVSETCVKGKECDRKCCEKPKKCKTCPTKCKTKCKTETCARKCK